MADEVEQMRELRGGVARAELLGDLFERVAMLLHGVPDIRAFYTNDLKFLKQFDESLL